MAVGVCLGWLGAGGTAIALPVLVYWVGLDPHEAVAVSLLIVGGSSAYGSVLYARSNCVRWRPALAFLPFGAVGAYLGSRWSYLLSGRTLLLAFGALLTFIALRMLTENEDPRDEKPHQPHRMWIGAAAAGIGIVTGLLGVGGGFLVVPAMVYLAGLGMRESIATSLVVVAGNAAVAFAGHLTRQRMEVGQLIFLLAAAMVGMTAGVALSHRTNPVHLKKAFAILLLALAGYMAVRNL